MILYFMPDESWLRRFVSFQSLSASAVSCYQIKIFFYCGLLMFAWIWNHLTVGCYHYNSVYHLFCNWKGSIRCDVQFHFFAGLFENDVRISIDTCSSLGISNFLKSLKILRFGIDSFEEIQPHLKAIEFEQHTSPKVPLNRIEACTFWKKKSNRNILNI